MESQVNISNVTQNADGLYIFKLFQLEMLML